VRPTGARVFLEGVFLGEGNQLVGNVAPGTYSVRATALGHMDFLQSVELTPGKTTRLQARMRSFDGGTVGTPLALGAGTGVPVHKRPAFWVSVSAGSAAVLVAVIAGAVQAAASEDPGPVPGTPAPSATYTFALP